MGIVSLILAIATVVLSLFFPYISVLTGIIGIVLGIVEMNRRKKIGGKKYYQFLVLLSLLLV